MIDIYKYGFEQEDIDLYFEMIKAYSLGLEISTGYSDDIWLWIDHSDNDSAVIFNRAKRGSGLFYYLSIEDCFENYILEGKPLIERFDELGIQF